MVKRWGPFQLKEQQKANTSDSKSWEILRVGLKKLGLKYLVDNKNPAHKTLAVFMPNHVDFTQMYNYLDKRGFTIRLQKFAEFNTFIIPDLDAVSPGKLRTLIQHLGEYFESRFPPDDNKYQLEGETGKIAGGFLCDIVGILDKHQIRYWLDFGTLLGVMREGRLLPWDNDLDISIFADDRERLLEKALPEIQAIAHRIYASRLKNSVGPLPKGFVRIVKIMKRYIRLDLFVMYRYEADFYWYESWAGSGYLHKVPEEFLQEFILVPFNGKLCRVPKEYDALLTSHYGDWRTPDKNYDALLDNTKTLVREKW